MRLKWDRGAVTSCLITGMMSLMQQQPVATVLRQYHKQGAGGGKEKGDVSHPRQYCSDDLVHVECKELGKYASSKHRNSVASSFGKSKRSGIDSRVKDRVPGFKYHRFSEFGTLS